MKTVAIIEDQTAIREMMSQAILSPNDYQVVVESVDGQIWMKIHFRQNPTLLSLDVMLPNCNGTEILRKISKELPQTRVLIFPLTKAPNLAQNSSVWRPWICREISTFD